MADCGTLVLQFFHSSDSCFSSDWTGGVRIPVEKISKDDDAYRQGNIYLLTGPDGREQYIIVRDLSGAVAIVKREPVRK